MSDPQKQYEGNEQYFVFEGKTLQAVPYAECSDCFFWGRGCTALRMTGRRPGCSSMYRTSGDSVIFVETRESLL